MPINPRWLSVDRATSFFRSVSTKALKPAYKVVKTQNHIINTHRFILEKIKDSIRIIRYKPAVTKVEE
jgi:hypothetical protein